MRIYFAAFPFTWLLYLCIAILVSWWVVIRVRRAAGIWHLRFYAFPRAWLKYLHKDVPLYNRLPLELRALYQDKVVQFVDAKLFRPCGTMEEVTWPEQVSIAGNACLLQLNTNDAASFPRILTVQVYRTGDADAEARLNCVALLWDGAKRQATDPRDQGNTALASIATQLGWETAGRSALPEALLLAPWARIHSPDFVKTYPGVLEKAAAGETADVFAVAAEMFLGAPAALQQRQPALYESMRLFYRVDPARWKTK